MFRTTKSALHFCFIPELISHTDCLSRENDFKISVVKGVYIKKNCTVRTILARIERLLKKELQPVNISILHKQ
jgi:hypothetical protein